MIFVVFEHSLMITVFVFAMMLLLEYITVLSKGNWNKRFSQNSWMQIIAAAILGIMPGCLGSFAVVSLYVHKSINFAALVTAMIATSGDEIFVMFSMIPDTALYLMVSIFFIAIITGFILNIFTKNKTLMKLPKNYLEIHMHDPDCVCFDKKLFIPELKKITFHRALLIFGLLLSIFFLISDNIVGHGHGHDHGWSWEQTSFMIVSILGLAIITTVPDHFLSHHLWKHTIKKHVPRIFVWTFGAFLLIHLTEQYILPEETSLIALATQYQLLILVIAVAIGVIPESGPHIVFISLFAGGTIPFSILLANSIVQDGHGAIPLFAESNRSFWAMKLVNIIVGFIAGLSGFYMGW